MRRKALDTVDESCGVSKSPVSVALLAVTLIEKSIEILVYKVVYRIFCGLQAKKRTKEVQALLCMWPCMCVNALRHSFLVHQRGRYNFHRQITINKSVASTSKMEIAICMAT